MSERTERKLPILFSIWLWLNIVTAAVCVLIYFLIPQALTDEYPRFSTNVAYAYGVMSILSLYSALLMLRWRRAGFWIYLALLVIGTATNVYYTDAITAFVGVSLSMITVPFLFLGGSKRLWNSFQ
jgi:hypothetical protein